MVEIRGVIDFGQENELQELRRGIITAEGDFLTPNSFLRVLWGIGYLKRQRWYTKLPFAKRRTHVSARMHCALTVGLTSRNLSPAFCRHQATVYLATMLKITASACASHWLTFPCHWTPSVESTSFSVVLLLEYSEAITAPPSTWEGLHKKTTLPGIHT